MGNNIFFYIHKVPLTYAADINKKDYTNSLCKRANAKFGLHEWLDKSYFHIKPMIMFSLAPDMNTWGLLSGLSEALLMSLISMCAWVVN